MVRPRPKRNVKRACVGNNGRTQMTAEAALRDPSVTREELQDLLNYLNGLPEEARRTGAFSAYEQRVAELSRELIFSDILFVFARQIPHEFPVELAAHDPTEYG